MKTYWHVRFTSISNIFPRKAEGGHFFPAVISSIILMSSKIISCYPFCSSLFSDRNPNNRNLSFPSSGGPFCLSLSKHSCRQTKLNFVHLNAKCGVTKVICLSGNDHQEASAPTPRKSDVSEWKKWAVGIVMSIVLPSFGHRMGPLLLLKSKVDMVLEKVEEVTEVVEKVAEATGEIAEMVEEKLPEDSVLRKDVDILQNLSETAVDKAKQAKQLVQQIEDIEEKLIESLVGPENNTAKEETGDKDVDRPVKT